MAKAISILRAERMPQLGRMPQHSGVGTSALIAGRNALNAGLDTMRLEISANREKEADIWAVKTAAQAQAEWTRRSIEAEQNAPAGAPGHNQTMVGDFAAYRDDLLAQAPTEAARQRLEMSFIHLGSNVDSRSLQFEHTKSISNQATLLGETIQTGMWNAYENPGSVGATLAQTIGAIQESSLDADTKAELIAKAKTDTTRAALTNLLESDPVSALGMLESNDALTQALGPELHSKYIAKARENVARVEGAALFGAAMDGGEYTSPTGARPAAGGVGGQAGRVIDGVPNWFTGWLDAKESGPRGYRSRNQMGSSASGRGQFMQAEWNRYRRQIDPAAAGQYASMADAPPAVQDSAIRWLYNEKAGAIREMGHEVNPQTMGIAWRYGQGMVGPLLDADPNASAVSVFRANGRMYKSVEAVISGNRIEGKTVGQVLAGTRMSGVAVASKPGEATVAPGPEAGYFDHVDWIKANANSEDAADYAITQLKEQYREFDARYRDDAKANADIQGALRAGLPIEIPTRGDLRRLYGSENATEAEAMFDQAARIGGIAKDMRAGTQEEARATLDSAMDEFNAETPEDFADRQEYAASVAAAYSARIEAINTDPSGYALTDDKVAQELMQTWAAGGEGAKDALDRIMNRSIVAQEDMGLPAGFIRPLPLAIAERIGLGLETAKPEEIGPMLMQMAAAFGSEARVATPRGAPRGGVVSDPRWGMVVNQMIQQGLVTPDIGVAARYADDAVLMKWIAPVLGAKTADTTALAPRGSNQSAEESYLVIREQVRLRFEEEGYTSAALAGENARIAADHPQGAQSAFQQLAAEIDILARAAAYKAGSSISGESGLESATVVADRALSHVEAINDPGTLVAFFPAGVDRNAIEATAEYMKETDQLIDFEPDLDNMFSGSDEVERQAIAEAYHNDATLITNDAGDGVVLAIPIGDSYVVARDKDGRSYGFTLEEMPAIMARMQEERAAAVRARSGGTTNAEWWDYLTEGDGGPTIPNNSGAINPPGGVRRRR